MAEEERREKAKKISRKQFLFGAGGAVVGGAVGGAVGGTVGGGVAGGIVANNVAQGGVPADGMMAAVTTSGKIEWTADACAACSRCLLACSVVHAGVASPVASGIVWQENDFLYGFRGREPLLCSQCDQPQCYYACPLKDQAMCIDPTTGARYIDQSKCDGCGECVKACPHSVPRITIDPEKDVAFKCDLCKDREAGPACVEVCDRQALTFVPRKEWRA